MKPDAIVAGLRSSDPTERQRALHALFPVENNSQGEVLLILVGTLLSIVSDSNNVNPFETMDLLTELNRKACRELLRVAGEATP